MYCGSSREEEDGRRMEDGRRRKLYFDQNWTASNSNIQEEV
jgi:hypothetical protein